MPNKTKPTNRQMFVPFCRSWYESYWILHRYLYGVLAGSVRDDGALNGLAVERDALHALLLTVWMDSDLVVGLAELTLNGIVASGLGQTGIDADTIVVGLDAKDEL